MENILLLLDVVQGTKDFLFGLSVSVLAFITKHHVQAVFIADRRIYTISETVTLQSCLSFFVSLLCPRNLEARFQSQYRLCGDSLSKPIL